MTRGIQGTDHVWIVMMKAMRDLKKVIDIPALEPLRKMDPRKGVESLLAFVERFKLPDHVREDFFGSYEGDRFFESICFLRAYKTESPKLSKLLPTIETLVQIMRPRSWRASRKWQLSTRAVTSQQVR